MTDQIIFKIGNVSTEEITQLNTAMSALSDSLYRCFSISLLSNKSYVVSISPHDSQEIKDTLKSLTRIFTADRIKYTAVTS